MTQLDDVVNAAAGHCTVQDRETTDKGVSGPECRGPEVDELLAGLMDGGVGLARRCSSGSALSGIHLPLTWQSSQPCSAGGRSTLPHVDGFAYSAASATSRAAPSVPLMGTARATSLIEPLRTWTTR